MQLSPVLLSALDRIGGAHTDELVRSFLSDPDSPAGGVAAIPSNAVNYAVCYVQRSGSTHLTSLLQNTGVAGKPADFFNAGYKEMRAEDEHVFARTGAYTIARGSEKYGCRSVADYLNTVAGLTRTSNGVFGVKMDLCHASILIRRGLFWSPDWNWKYIYVTRRDLLMQAISFYTAQSTGQWSSLSAGKSAVAFDADAILQCLRYLTELMGVWECMFAALGIEPLRIAYEDIESDPDQVVTRCLRYIGIESAAPPIPQKSLYQKQRTPRAEEWAEEIRAGSRGTRLSGAGKAVISLLPADAIRS